MEINTAQKRKNMLLSIYGFRNKVLLNLIQLINLRNSILTNGKNRQSSGSLSDHRKYQLANFKSGGFNTWNNYLTKQITSGN